MPIRRRDFQDWNFRFVVWIILATIPIVVAGEFLKPVLNACDSPLRTLTVIGIACIVMSGLLVLAEIYSRPKRTLDHATLKDAMIIGLAQIGALIPGVSRSGSTLTAALFRDLTREEAARFSFLLGLPAIAGAGSERIMGAAQGPSRRAWLVGPWVSVFSSHPCRHLPRFGACCGFSSDFQPGPSLVYRGLMGIFLLACVYFGWLPN